MSYRTVLVHVDGSDAGLAALHAAVHLAQQHDAKLIGLHVMEPAAIPGDNRMRLGVDYVEMLRRRRAENAAETERLFRDAARDVARTDWEAAELNDGSFDSPAIVARSARCADLTVVGQVGVGERVADRPGALPEQLVLQSGRPILVVPPATAAKSVAERVLVAWDQSREAARALGDALPLLERAKQVWVLTIGERADRVLFDGDGRDRRAERALAYLAAHDIPATALNDTAGTLDASEILLSRAADQSADLIVLGAYGHSRLRELVLGGVTRDILSHMTVPVLMAH